MTNSLITQGCDFNHPQLGRVHMVVRSNSKRISARWKNGIVHLNVPYGITHTEANNVLNKFAPALLKKRCQLRFHNGQQIVLDGVTFNISRQSLRPDHILGQVQLPNVTISAGTNVDFENEETTISISRLICRIAHHIAPKILLPFARQIAERVGKSPKNWTISTGHSTLGYCNADGQIALSYMLIFLPPHLREYIICHELAHLSEMNHSIKFHQICDRYCNGKEKAYISEVNSFNWPILK